MENKEHPVIRGLTWILENRTKPNGKKMSMRYLSIESGRAESQVEQILSGRQSADISLDLAQDLARIADVDVAWLLTGHGAPGHYRDVERVELDRDARVAPLIDEATKQFGLSDEQRRELAETNWSVGTSFGTIVSAANDIVNRDRRRGADNAVADSPRSEVVLDLVGHNKGRRVS
jgi:transcriptional regulator with XRE-family HTH domain